MAALARLGLVGHGGVGGLVAEIVLAVLVAGALGIVWVRERRRVREAGKREAPMRDDLD